MIHVEGISPTECRFGREYVSREVFDLAIENRISYIKKVEDEKEYYDRCMFLTRLGLKKSKNLSRFYERTYNNMFNLIKLFKKTDTEYISNFPKFTYNDLIKYINSDGLTIYKTPDYNKQLSDENVDKLKDVLDLIESNTDMLDFYNLLYKSEISDYWFDQDIKDLIPSILKDLKNNKKDFICEDGKRVDTSTYSSKRIRLEYKNIIICENDDQSKGIIAMEYYKDLYFVLLDWNNNKDNALDFKEYVENEKNKVEQDTETDLV